MFPVKPKDQNKMYHSGFTISASQQERPHGAALQRHPGFARSLGNRQAGFTIIEVLIVLAIAGLIMVVVFLAVPALERSGRNNALGTDARNVLAGVNTYMSQNANTLPTSVSYAAGAVTIGDSSSNREVVKVDNAMVGAQLNGTAITAAGDGSSPVGTIQIITGTSAVCNSTDTGLDSGGGASPRAAVLVYVAESGSGNILKCLGS